MKLKTAKTVSLEGMKDIAGRVVKT